MRLRGLPGAIAFLSRFPLPARLQASEVRLGDAAAWFPLVGALLGGLEGLVAVALTPVLTPTLAALFACGVGVVATGALHLDGLADSSDGLFGGRTRDDALRIMRDHAIGAYGALALLLVVGVEVMAIAALIVDGSALTALVVAGAAGRLGLVVQPVFLRYARAEEGLGRALDGSLAPVGVSFAIASTLAVAGAVARGRGMAACLAALLVVTTTGAYCNRRIGGYTGDTLGATAELSRALALVVLVALR
jgi:adenosylcobinamide-GDP ribazoletransferase